MIAARCPMRRTKPIMEARNKMHDIVTGTRRPISYLTLHAGLYRLSPVWSEKASARRFGLKKRPPLHRPPCRGAQPHSHGERGMKERAGELSRGSKPVDLT